MNATNELSFLPDDYLERKAQRRTNVVCAMLFLIVMVAIGSAFTFTERQIRAVEKRHAEITQQYTDAAKRIEQVRQLQENQKKMAHQAELTASLLEKIPRSFLLADITNAMPGGVSLLDFVLDSKQQVMNTAPQKTAFELKKEAREARKADAGSAAATPAPPPPAQPKVYSVTVKLTGIANTDVQVAQFITRLNQSKLLKDVNLLISDQYQQGEEKLRKFQIEAVLSPQADAQLLKPTKTVSIELN